MPLSERALWGEDLESIADGEALAWDGTPVHLRTVIQRRWGWPKRAAVLVQEYCRALQAETGTVVRIKLQDPERFTQQQNFMRFIPDLQRTLMAGLARGNDRERNGAHLPVKRVELRFDQPVADDGLVSSVLETVAARLGCTLEELRQQDDYGDPVNARITRRGPDIEMSIKVSAFEP